MSRDYEMYIEINDFEKDREDAIADAANNEWPFENWYCHNNSLGANGESNLDSGIAASDFA